MCRFSNSQESIIRSYEHSEGVYSEVQGLAQIRGFYTYLLDKGSRCELDTAPVSDLSEVPANMYFISDCPDTGIWGANDNFLFSSDFKILAQV